MSSLPQQFFILLAEPAGIEQERLMSHTLVVRIVPVSVNKQHLWFFFNFLGIISYFPCVSWANKCEGLILFCNSFAIINGNARTMCFCFVLFLKCLQAPSYKTRDLQHNQLIMLTVKFLLSLNPKFGKAR